jgi:hypothetical protein
MLYAHRIAGIWLSGEKATSVATTDLANEGATTKTSD